MSFTDLAPSALHTLSPRPPSRHYRCASEAVRVLVCQLVAFGRSEACMAVPAPNWLTVTLSANGRAVTLEVLDQHEADPMVRGRVAVRSVDDARAAALRAGVIEDFSAEVAA